MGSFSTVTPQLRVGLPILTAGALGLLVAAHVLKGASTEVDGYAPLGTLKPHTASNDNLFSAIQRLADAKAWLMVFIVAILSGIWPYLKLILTICLVALADLGMLSTDACYRWLCLLEVLGKYSFADVILICFNAVIFDITTGGSYRILAFGSLEMELYMHLKFASVALILAVTASAFLTHWAAHVLGPSHSLKRTGTEQTLDNDLEVAPLLQDAGQQRRVRPSWSGLAVALAALLGGVLLVVGSCIPSMEVQRSGFLGKLIRPNSEQDLEMSIFTISQRMLEAARTHGDDALAFFAVLFVILTFVVPLLELMALIAHGVGLLFPHALRRCGALSELAAAWFSSFAVVDIYLIVCIAVLTEIQTVVDFNIGSECSPFAALLDNRALLKIAGLGFAASDTCFEPRPSLRNGWWLLLASVILRIAAWRGVAMAARTRSAYDA